MERVLSLWLPRFSTDRLCRRREAADGHAPTPWRSEPLVTLTAEGGRGERLISVNRAAELVGLTPDRTLADARALVPDLRALEYDSMDEIKALAALADWCGRYSPWTAVDGIEANGAGGIWIDITGVAHLFGGEEALLADLTARLDSFGYIVRAGLSDTPGAAWALARFGVTADSNWRVEAPGTGAQTLASLPVAGLRLTPQIHASLLHLGLRTIGDVLPLPRASLAARFGAELVRRIDQALGRIKEPIMPRPSALVTRLRFALPEPASRLKDITAAAHRLLTAMCQRLEYSGRGVCQLELALYRIDGYVTRVPVGTNCASRNPDHLMRLLATSLERLPNHASTEAPVDLLVLTVRSSTPLASVQSTLHRTLTDTSNAEDHAALAALNDRLVSRLGAAAVRQLWTRASHLPERAQVSTPTGTMPKVAVKARSYSPPTPTPYKEGKNSQNGLSFHKVSPSVEESCAGVDKNKSHPNTETPPRPLRLLAPPQSVEATALVSDEPPCLFRWQGQMYRVAHADGPERLAPEWWRGSTMPNGDDLARRTRDYYRVEDTRGRRFWLYREGLYGAAAPRWFLHGLFG